VARLHVVVVLGTRPEAIKLAPVIEELRRRPATFRVTICFTGQHEELLRPIAEYFGIVPDVDLKCLVRGDSLAAGAARVLTAVDGALAESAPDCVVVQGDTTTVVCAALAAFYRQVPLVHVEAGLRTYDLNAPWPEELNRRVATLTAWLHCAPTPGAVASLRAEGVAAERIVMTGNTVVDALLATLRRERENHVFWEAKYPRLKSRPMVLITGHRRENHGQGVLSLCSAINMLSERYPNTMFFFPVHPNPRVCEPVRRILRMRENLCLSPPVTYPEFVWLMDRSTFIITDSGGVQEEAPSLAKPVLVTRESTERPEAVACGVAKLVGADADAIVSEARKILDGEAKLAEAIRNPYGDGRAAERIVEAMMRQLSPK
jgi:UDP-N-acetylglucosamine 2-epimerase (non-hydrolysing)